MKTLACKLAVLFLLLPGIAMAQVLLGVSTGSGQTSANPGAIFSIDPATGLGTLLGTPFNGVGLSGIAMTSDGRVYVSTSASFDGASHLLEVDPVTGNMINDVGQILDVAGNSCGVGDLSVDPTSGILYGMATNHGLIGTRCGVGGSTGGYLLSINPNTAVYTLLGTDPAVGGRQGGIAFSRLGTLYFSEAWSPDGDLHTLSTLDGTITGTTTLIPTQTWGYHGLGVDPVTGMLYATLGDSNASDLYSIDPNTGNVTTIGPISSIGDRIHDVVYYALEPPVPVPTISTWGIIALMLAILFLVASRFRRQTRY